MVAPDDGFTCSAPDSAFADRAGGVQRFRHVGSRRCSSLQSPGDAGRNPLARETHARSILCGFSPIRFTCFGFRRMANVEVEPDRLAVTVGHVMIDEAGPEGEELDLRPVFAHL